jgi:probable HAF family extracellular repeat protein
LGRFRREGAHSGQCRRAHAAEAHRGRFHKISSRQIGPLVVFFHFALLNVSIRQIVGVAYTRDFHALAFLYQNGRMQSLGTLGVGSSVAMAINGAGQVVGQASTSGDASLSAFLWQSGTMIDIDTLGSAESIGQAINSAGVVVGRANISTDPDFETWHAFVYRNGQMVDLTDLIPANSGWVLTTATGINDTGHIVGSGTLNGESMGFLLTPQ